MKRGYTCDSDSSSKSPSFPPLLKGEEGGFSEQIPHCLNRRGYTMVELMIVIAIMGILMLLGPDIFKGMYRFVRLATAKVEIQRGARVTLSNINRALRQSQASSIVVDQASGQPPHSRISFTRYKPDGSTPTISYYQQGKKLYMSVNGAAGQPIAENLRYIAFSYPKTDDAGIISISLTFEKETYEGGAKALQMAVEKVRIMN
ncbi:MAG: prepilin-type N-terminal cleavage/methylation domain-containing protein [Elusimicrobia bacterium]|nr:prepilin-type N-terminal cleavage/methylation domain-containing protein [Elusimicrobiota bacterium]